MPTAMESTPTPPPLSECVLLEIQEYIFKKSLNSRAQARKWGLSGWRTDVTTPNIGREEEAGRRRGGGEGKIAVRRKLNMRREKRDYQCPTGTYCRESTTVRYTYLGKNAFLSPPSRGGGGWVDN
jgi:hypothetical protein